MKVPESATVSRSADCELRDVIDHELGRLPDVYRTPIVLCHLEGKRHKEAAEQLGWPIGTLSGRLSRARTILAKRLARRGLVLTSGILDALSSEHASGETVAPMPARTTAISVRALTAARATPGLVPAQVAALSEGVLKTMLLRKVKIGTLLAVCVIAAGFGVLALAGDGPEKSRTSAASQPAKRPPNRGNEPRERGSADLLEELDWALTAVDADNRRISALARWTWNTMANDEFASSSLRTGLHLSFKDLPVAKDAEILINGKPGTLKGLAIDKATFQARYGMQTVLKFSDDGTTITKIDARSQNSYFYLQGVDARERTIMVSVGASGRLAQRHELPLARNARIIIPAEKSRTKEGLITDLKPGMQVSLELAAENGRIVVRGLRAQD
jgi:hypothetical protein